MKKKLIGALVCMSAWLAAAQTPPALPAVPVYDMEVQLQPEAHLLRVNGTMRLPAEAGARTSLELVLAEQMRDFQVAVLEPAEAAGAATVTAASTKEHETTYRIQLSHPVAAHQPILLRFSFVGGEKTGFVFYVGEEGSFAGGTDTAWYPQISRERPKGTGTLKFTVPTGYTVVASGAAAARSDRPTFDVRIPQSFSFAAGRYTVVRQQTPVPLSIYLLRPRANIANYFERYAKTVNYLVEQFGPLPYGEMRLVEVPPEQSRKAGFSGASFEGMMLADSTSIDSGFNQAFYAHEIAHQWWGNLISLEGSKGDYMLDEAMAQFGSLLTVETLEGAGRAEQYRRTGYPGYSPFQNAAGFFLYSAAGLDEHPLDSLPHSTISHELADNKGFLVMDLLSRTVGREKFRQALQQFTRRHPFQGVRWEDFLSEVEANAGQDLTWFNRQWFQRTGAPDWKLEWRRDAGGVTGVITQAAPYYRVSLQVEAYGSGCRRVSRVVEIEGARTEFSLPASFEVERVELDPHFEVLHWTSEARERAVALAPATAAMIKGETANNPEQMREDLEAALAKVPVPDKYGAGFLAEATLARVYAHQQKWEEAKTHSLAALAKPTRPAEILPWVYLQLATIAKHLKDDALLRSAVEGAVSADAVLEVPTGIGAAAKALLK